MSLHTATLTDIHRQELAAILAGLRLLQTTSTLPDAIEETATDCGDLEPLDAEQIDDLCERINGVSEFPWRDMPNHDAETAALEARVASLFEQIEGGV